MDFQLSEEQLMLQEMARNLSEREFKDRESEWDQNEEFPREYLPKLAELGLLGITLPEEYGGGGRGAVDAILVIEQFARFSTSAALIVFEGSVGPVRVISNYGSEEQKRKYLPPVCRGEKMIGVGMTEPNAGSDLGNLRTKGVLEGDYYIVNGSKVFTGGAPESEAYVVYVRLSEQKGSKGVGGLIIDKGTPGFTMGKTEEKMGLRGFPHGSLYFDDCHVPRENLVIPESGFKKLMAAFSIERCGNATLSLGIAQGAYELALNYVKVRRQFRKDLCEFQGIQWILAEMAVKLDAARLLIYRATSNAATGFPSILESSIAKMYANEIAKEVCDAAMQLHGGYGDSREYPLERMYRDVRAFSIAGGTVQILRNMTAQPFLNRKFGQKAS